MLTGPLASANGRRAHSRRRRGGGHALWIIIAVGVIGVAAAVALARALDDTRSHGRYLIGAWTFGHTSSLETAVEANAIDEISVDWLQSRADGSLAAPQHDADFVPLAKEKDCRVFVTLTDYSQAKHTFDPAISAAVLATAETRRRHAAAVTDWCRANDVDGVDVDWEAVKAAQRDGFTAFVEELAERLHDADCMIAVDVYPKTMEPGGWDGPQGQDWARLGRTVDQFRIMTYNYSGSWSNPGPLSPPDWMDRVLDFAETQVPPERIVMGIGFYGRAWRGSATTDLVWNDVATIRASYEPLERRAASQELRLDYSRDGRQHTAFFPDAVAIRAKLRMLRTEHPDIHGVYAWCMGQEDPRVWGELRAVLD